MNTTDIKRQIKEIKTKLIDIADEILFDPRVIAAEQELANTKKLVRKARQPEVDKLEKTLVALEQSLISTRRPEYEPPSQIQLLIERAKRGVDWGNPFRVKPLRINEERYFVLSIAGKVDWAGVGQRRYYPSTHYLIDVQRIDKNKYGLSAIDCCKVERTECRVPLSKWRDQYKI